LAVAWIFSKMEIQIRQSMKKIILVILFIIILTGFDVFGKKNDYVEISSSKIKVIIDLKLGGRVIEYSKNGNNVLFVRTEGDSEQTGPDGGRCDFGPERIAPPRPETWLGEWELVEKTENFIKIKSQVAKAAGVQLFREFLLSKESTHLKFTQTIINVSDSPKRYCHWSRTFGEPNGICLAPLNPKSRFPKGYMVYTGNNKLDYSPKGGENERVRDGILELLGPPENPKFVTDGSEGWLAYITPNNQLFLKTFEVFPEKVYGEMTGATVSIWYNREGICEIEPIGPWESINPGESISFSENWYIVDFDYPKDKMADLIKIKSIVGELGK
jgi:hypothetical protein